MLQMNTVFMKIPPSHHGGCPRDCHCYVSPGSFPGSGSELPASETAVLLLKMEIAAPQPRVDESQTLGQSQMCSFLTSTLADF